MVPVCVEAFRLREMKLWRYGFVVALVLFPCSLQAQPASSFDEVGRFYVSSFAPEDYNARPQNWGIVQDERGFIYVGNSDGVLEYDGVSWRLIPISNRSIARSLAVDAQGRIYVGAIGELGELAPDSLGRMRYVSLVEHIPAEDRNFSDVWKTYALPEGVYFQSVDRLFRWQDGQMKVWRTQTRFHLSHVVRDTFYVHVWERGLYSMAQDTLRRAPGGATFAGQDIYALVPHGADAYLAITRSRGIFRCRSSAPFEEACARFSPGLTDLLVDLQPYHATVLPDGSVAIGTLRGGVILLDRAGRLLHILNEASGLRNETVWYTYVDRQGGLWLGLDNGLARVEVAAPVTYFDKTTGLAGAVNSVARHRGRLYAATSLGVYSLVSAAEGARFMAYPGISRECWSLLSTPQGLLAGCLGGLYNLDDQQLIWPLSGGHVHEIYRTRGDTTLLYLGLTEGLARMRLRAGRWRDAGRLDGVRERVRSIIEDAQGRLWMGTRSDGVLRVEAATAAEPVLTRFGVEHGLPTGWVHARALAGRVTFLSDVGDGLFRMHTGSGSVGFVSDTTFDAFLPQDTRSINDLTEDEQGRVWISAGDASGVALPSDNGGYTFVPTALRRTTLRDAYVMVAEAGGPVWVGQAHGLIRLDTAASLDSSTAETVWIRRITTANDSLLFDGHRTRPDKVPLWPYRHNALRFAFAAPRFDTPERTQYRTWLEGFNDHWTNWSEETDKEFTNLSEGQYVFRVQARDVYGLLSREDTFAFRILPPWYRAWWAWALYGLMATGLIGGGYQLRTRSLRRRNKQLYQEIEHRKRVEQEREKLVAELEVQNTQRQRLNAELEQRVHDRTAELEAKNDELERFSYTVSHDLKSPLVTIKGFLGLLEKDTVEGNPERIQRDIRQIQNAADTMQRLIDELLELSRIGHEALPLEEVSLTELAHEVVQLLAGRITERGVTVTVAPEWPTVFGDRVRLWQVLQNLIDNAVKFMGDQPEPRIEIGGSQQDQQVVCYVRDNGAGIEPRFQDKVFGLFKRLDTESEGTGIGLAAVKRIVEAHGGRLWVESAGRGCGSTFYFTLPLGPSSSPQGFKKPSALRRAGSLT